MTTTRFQEEWKGIAVRWSLRVETPFIVKLAEREVTVPVLLRDFGGSHGMLLVTDFSLISPYTDELVNLGYGFSCLSEPTGVDHPEDDQALMEMLSDWGWSGIENPPVWYREPTS
jgi:hypothetical protein